MNDFGPDYDKIVAKHLTMLDDGNDLVGHFVYVHPYAHCKQCDAEASGETMPEPDRGKLPPANSRVKGLAAGAAGATTGFLLAWIWLSDSRFFWTALVCLFVTLIACGFIYSPEDRHDADSET